LFLLIGTATNIHYCGNLLKMSHLVTNENMVVDKNGNISKVAYTNYDTYTYPCGTLSHQDQTTYFVSEKGVITYYNLPDQPISKVEVPSVESVAPDTPTPPKELPIIQRVFGVSC
jgi:hypothetical protein